MLYAILLVMFLFLPVRVLISQTSVATFNRTCSREALCIHFTGRFKEEKIWIEQGNKIPKLRCSSYRLIQKVYTDTFLAISEIKYTWVHFQK